MIKKLWEKFNSSSNAFIKAITLLASGSILGQVIGFVGSMVMTRLYTKADIAVMNLIVSVTGMFTSAINGRVDYAIVKEQEEKRIFPLVKLSILIGLAFSTIVSVGSIFYFWGKRDVVSPFVAALFVLLSLGTVTFTNVFRSYNNHVQDYKTMTSVIVLRKLAEEISMAVMGLIYDCALGLNISRVIGQFFGMRQQTKNLRHRTAEIMAPTKSEMKEAFQIHKKQLYYSAPAALVNSASYYILTLFLGVLYPLEEIAVYSISMSVLGLPLSLISSNVSKVYYDGAAREFAATGQFRSSTMKSLKLLSLLALPVFVGMYWIIPILVPVVYGSAYANAGVYIRILAPMFTVRFVTSSLTTGLLVANLQQLELILQSGFVVTSIVVFLVCRIVGAPITTFVTYISVVYSAVYIAYFGAVYWASGRKTKQV